MNGIEKITARIMEEAGAEADRITAEARAKADAVAAEYREKAETAYAEALEAGKAEAQHVAERRRRAAQLHEKKSLLALKQELIEEAYGKARDLLLTMPRDEYVAFLAKEAAAASVSGTEKIILNAKDSREIGEALVKAANLKLAQAGRKTGLTLAEETREIAGGLFLREGNVEVNCTIDSLLEHVHEEMDIKVAKELFG